VTVRVLHVEVEFPHIHRVELELRAHGNGCDVERSHGVLLSHDDDAGSAEEAIPLQGLSLSQKVVLPVHYVHELAKLFGGELFGLNRDAATKAVIDRHINDSLNETQLTVRLTQLLSPVGSKVPPQVVEQRFQLTYQLTTGKTVVGTRKASW